jgi:hypothetical protein
MRKETAMTKKDRLNYEEPTARIVDLRTEWNFLLSGGNGDIDPGTDDPWGDY